MRGTDTSATIAFTHVPKVAGTSILKRLIRENYDRDAIKTYRGELDLIRSRGTFRVLVGYSTYGAQFLIPGHVRLFTMLRDPVDRAVSHYYFTKQPFEDPRIGGNVEQKQFHNETPLADIFERNAKRKWRLAGTWLVDNMQTRYLAGYAHYWKPASSRSLLAAAKRHLEHDYAEFGIQSRFEDSVERIADCFGWTVGAFSGRAKATQIKKTLTDDDRDAVEKWNLLDRELFDFAQELFRKRGMP